MKYILCVTVALCLAVPFLTQSTVYCPAPNLIDLTSDALISRYERHGNKVEFYKTVYYDTGLVVRHRTDGTWEHHYE